MSFKIIKKKDFTFKQDGVDTSATHYTLAYKGRVFGCSSLRFDEGELTESPDDKTLSIKGELEIRQEKNVDQITGETQNFLSFYPKLDLQLAAI